MKTDYFNDQLEDKAVIIKSNEGERYEIGETHLPLK